MSLLYNNPEVDIYCSFIHCASLNDGVEMAWLADSEKTNVVLQNAIKEGWKRSVMFADEMPDDGKIYLKELGNRGNDTAQKMTVLEVYRSIDTVERGWEKNKNGELEPRHP